jgi:hypothetical protein
MSQRGVVCNVVEAIHAAGEIGCPKGNSDELETGSFMVVIRGYEELFGDISMKMQDCAYDRTSS